MLNKKEGEKRKMKKADPRLAPALEEARKQMESGLIQGGVISTLTQEPVPFGLQDVAPREAVMTADSRFDIASVGKVFTASCCAALAAEGKLDPDAPFTEYLPDHVLGKTCRITVRNLATHTGGFANARHYGAENPDDFTRTSWCPSLSGPAGPPSNTAVTGSFCWA